MHEITFKAFEYLSAFEALQHTEAEGGEAVLLDGRNFVMTQAEADCMDVARRLPWRELSPR